MLADELLAAVPLRSLHSASAASQHFEQLPPQPHELTKAAMLRRGSFQVCANASDAQLSRAVKSQCDAANRCGEKFEIIEKKNLVADLQCILTFVSATRGPAAHNR
jgi:hypothetical protein